MFFWDKHKTITCYYEELTKTVKEGASKEEAEALKAKFEEAGATIELA